MIRVLEIRKDGTAVVSTRGLRRVVIQPGNEIVDELVTPHEAAAYIRGFNGAEGHFGKWRAESITYGESFRRGA